MPINSRAKGASGEREACTYLEATLGGKWTRTGSAQRKPGHMLPDVVSDQWPHLHIEVKRGKRNLNLWAALAQAKGDCAPDRVPLVLARRDRAKWVLFGDAGWLLSVIAQ